MTTPLVLSLSQQLVMTFFYFNFVSFLRDKCFVRNVSFDNPSDFFHVSMLNYVEKTWSRWLGPLVPDLPAFKEVIGELRPQIEALLLVSQ